MNFRETTINDISQIQIVRNSVRENQLSDPSLVSDKDCGEYLTVWVCEIDDEVAGFSIADIHGNNIWALFVRPAQEGKDLERSYTN